MNTTAFSLFLVMEDILILYGAILAGPLLGLAIEAVEKRVGKWHT